nr:1-(5-phosphoribosyl)-5-[(5-phosphoribosylamino)methylideneamino]imidazole-4-carboxamide isomerase [Natranaerobius trueperi]
MPGVCSFKEGLRLLESKSFREPIENKVKEGMCLFGICLGMQLLFESGTEGGKTPTPGLSLIEGNIEKFSQDITIPHVGWSQVKLKNNHEITRNLEDDYFYFVHSYKGNNVKADNIIGETMYGELFPSFVAHENIMGTQFHPEKQQKRVEYPKGIWEADRMQLELIPAIDLIDGKCVRLTEGELNQKKTYSNKPYEIAKYFEEQGASRLHLVDLDGAFKGQMTNIKTIERIVQAIDTPVQVGGGIRNFEKITSLLDLGVDRIILGTKAYKDPEFLQTVLEKYQNQVVVGVDVKADKVATEGWVQVSETSTYDYIRTLVDKGVKRIILTDVSRDGKLEGLNLQLLKELLSFNINIIMSGGVGSLDDLIDLMDLQSENLEGVILGKALYENRFELKTALQEVK